jgi:deoxyribonuclease-4
VFGSHLSIAGSLVNALRQAEALRLDTVQIFTKNQQQWRVRPLDPAVVREWRAETARLGWDRGGPTGGGRTVSHASYLINLASPDDELWRRSVDLMTEEIERCEALAIPFLVHHPGSYTDGSPESGLARIVDAYTELFRRTPGYSTVSCLEGTVGAGRTLGGRFEHLAELRRRILDASGQSDRLGFCLDTCHMHAAGYDLRTREQARGVLGEFDRVCGLAHVRVVHLNDSSGAAGSKLDRHAHIGEGTIGGGVRRLRSSGFAEFVNHPALARVPKILETPKGNTPRGTPWDLVNVNRLRRLVERRAGE